MGEIGELTGRKYRPFKYYGAPDAENIIVAMGSATENHQGDHRLPRSHGRKYGLISVHLYRPFSRNIS